MPPTASDPVDLSVSPFSAYIYIEISVWLLTNIAKATHHYRQIGHHISEKTQPAGLIDRVSRADIVTYYPVSGLEHA